MLATILRRTKSMFRPKADGFLREVSGVIHVGANTGQERDLYRHHGLRVVWVEPIPDVFSVLHANLASYPLQLAVQCLVTDKDDQEYAFHVSNNDGLSSSILPLKLHRDIWPEVAFTRTLTLRSATLPSVLRGERINLDDYDALVMDTQGSELMILRGAVPILRKFNFIKTEVPDFESYEGCCQLRDVEQFLARFGFREHSRQRFARRREGGSYYDVTYQRVS